tara:strand:- start:1353 stop:1961 length:609 start_codon:yes stop_codon:yes gene_type:complete
MPLSTIAANQIKQGTIVDANINSSANIATTKLGTGSIIQTITHQEDGLTSFTASGTSDKLLVASGAADSTSHLSVTITPNFSNSKILISTSIFFEGNQAAHSYLWAFHRDSTKLSAATDGSRRTGIANTAVGYGAIDQDSTAEAVNMMYVDSPNSTSAIVYSASFQHGSSGAIVYINRTKTDTDSAGYERGISMIMAQEIKV